MTKSDNGTLSKAKPVGYGKPPEQSRFQRGKSGNPNGRPKGILNFATALQKTLREIVVITENGRRKQITKLEAAVKQLVNKGASGNLRALAQLIGIVLSAEQRAAEEMASNDVLTDLDQRVLLKILKRYEQNARDNGNREKTVGE